MAVIREFLGAERLLGTQASETPSPTTTSIAAPSDAPAHPVNEAADITGWGRGGDSMKRTYAIRALLSVVSALSAIFLAGGANASW